MMFALRFSLCAIDNLLLLLPLCCLLADYYLALASCRLDPSFLVARPSPFTACWLYAYYMPSAITLWKLTAHGSLFSVFDPSLTKRRALLVVCS